MGLDRSIVMYIYHYTVRQSIFSALKIPCTLPIHFPHSSATINTVIIVLPSTGHYTVGIIYHVAFLDWLLSLTNIHLSFLYVFSYLDMKFIFSAKYYSFVWMGHRFFYPFTY